MPRAQGQGKGDLYITFKIEFPRQLDDAQRKTLRQVLSP
jgi:DnaJ-class molecular chaperone